VSTAGPPDEPTRDSPEERPRDFLPALRFDFLTPIFDPVVRVGMRERRFKRELVSEAAIEPAHRVLDLGCGTGTLAILAKQTVPDAEVIGLDGDPAILERARAKAEAAGVDVRFDAGYSTELPYEPASFDRVLSTLFFHHLNTEDKRRTLAEIARVLRPGGRLLVVDFTRPGDPLMAACFMQVRVFDGFERTSVNARGELGTMMSEAGLRDVGERSRLRTAMGRLGLTSGTLP
jgi:cyclopropane fatty-acyl-phospholipid synthase-like methyltransferase